MKLRVKRIIFAAIILIGVVITGLVRWPIRFQTDLTSLLNLETAENWPVQDITNRFSGVINIVVQSENRADGEIAAYKIRDIVTSDAFLKLDIWVNDLSPRAAVATIGKYHNGMIGMRDRALLMEQRYGDITANARMRVETSMMPKLLPLSEDPFLLFTNYVSEMGNSGTNWIAQNGVLWQYRAPYNFYMLPIGVNVTDNAELVDYVKRLKSAVANIESDKVHVYIGGAPIHTAEMYHSSKIELGVISVLALIAAVLLNYMLFRRIWTIIPIGVSLAVGYLAGTIALFLCFGEPHILVFVFGTSLVGLGIDYGFHFMCISKNEDVRVVHRNILHSLLTTLICFAPLGFASIGLLRQVSLFTIVGLLAIYLFMKLFVTNTVSYIPKKERSVRPVNAKYQPYIICGIAVLAIVACAFARIENNMASMYRPNGDLITAEKIIGELNQSDKTGLLVVRGQDIQSVLETEEAIRDSGTHFFGVSTVIPSVKRQMENNHMVQELYKSQAKTIRKALELRKMPQFAQSDIVAPDDDSLGALKGQIERFLVRTDGDIYAVSSVPADTVITNENAMVIAPAQQIQNQMERFSCETYNLLIICGLVLMVGLLFLYKLRAFRYLMPPMFGVIVSVALLTVMGMPITFFHLLGLFIVIGLGIDYAIFHTKVQNNAELRPVFYSFLTSFIGFGMLAFTSFFLVAAMGLILAIGIAVSYLVSLYLFRN